MRAVTVGLCAHLIALASFADFHAFVSGNYGSSPFSLTTYDTATGSFGHFSQVPSGATKILASPNGAELWILGLTGPSSAETGYISIVSTTTQKVLATLPLPDVSPYSLCFNVCPERGVQPERKLCLRYDVWRVRQSSSCV